MFIGRKIYYDTLSGNVLVDTGERSGSVIELAVEQEIEIYNILAERRRDTFDVLHLEYGQYREDFAICSGYRVDLATKQLQFSYPDPNEQDATTPFQMPLSERVSDLEAGLNFILMGGI